MKKNFLFYPVSAKNNNNAWQEFHRHQFDTSNDSEIVEALSEVKGETKIVRTDNDVEYEADLFNDWDDYAEGWLISELTEIVEKHNLGEEFVKEHWCIAVSDNVADMLEQAE